MGKKAGTSFYDRALHRIRKLFFSLLKVVYIIPFFLFGLWLLSVVYFPGFDLNASVSLLKYRKDNVEFNIISRKKETVPRDHFHMVDAYVEGRDAIQPTCVLCHGMYAHGKEKKVRAFLNMHNSVIACSVCHVRKDKIDAEGRAMPGNEMIEYLWVDRESGEFKNSVDGEYGKYPAKIFPVTDTGKGFRNLLTPITEEAARQFLEMAPQLTEKQLDEQRVKLHEGITKEPVSCGDCHKKDGYLDFRKLGFPKQRIDNLVSSEFVGMIDKYETFHLPSVIDFSGE